MFANEETLIKDVDFKLWKKQFETDVGRSATVIMKTQYGVKLVNISILDRMTGFGHRDVETGFRDVDNAFWLASGEFDIRWFPDLTVKDAIAKIKHESNNCRGGYTRKSFPVRKLNG
jgi:hypothetical protein